MRRADDRLSDDIMASYEQAMLDVRPDVAILNAQLDPDGIAASLIQAEVCLQYGIRPHIYYAGAPGHPQTLAMLDKLNLAKMFCPISQWRRDLPVMLLDSSDLTDGRIGDDVLLDPRIIIDHHDGLASRIDSERFWMVEYPCGSATTLALHLMMSLGMHPDTMTATAAAVGIYSDTHGLNSEDTTGRDEKMYAFAKHFCDRALYRELTRFRMSERHCRIVQQVLTHRVMVGRVLIAHPAMYLDRDEGEILAIAADLIGRHEDADVVLVCGVAGFEHRVAARSWASDFPLDPFLKGLFGPTAGAKKGSGGARVSLGHLAREIADQHQGFLAHAYEDVLARVRRLA